MTLLRTSRGRWAAAVAALVATCSAGLVQADVAPDRAATRFGVVQGRVADGVAVFRGLPYAAPPVGARRWRAPEWPAAWGDAVRPAVANGAACPQPRGPSLEGGGDVGPVSEDCLVLNVWRPVAAAEPLPVLVWLHGGAFVLGSGGLDIYDGAPLARRDALVVTVNYRLGHLGYFAHPAFEREQPGGPVNFGLLDQIQALRWVQDNIAAFGGDPRRVTVAGQSAGAQSVLALMASPLAQGLFQRAVAQSAYGIASHTRDAATAIGAKVAAHAGLSGAAASGDALRRLSVEQLLAAQAGGLTLAPNLVAGDAALPRPIADTFRAGRQARVPLLIGSTSDEASVAAAFGLDTGRLLDQLGRAKVLVQALYPGVTDPAQLGREVVRDAVFTAYARRIAVLHAAQAPTWRYYFAQRPAGRRGEPGGVGHGGDVPYVFGTTRACGCLGDALDAADAAVERRVGDHWFAFARDGALPWTRDDRLRGTVLEIGESDVERPRFMRPRLNAFIAAGNAVQRGTIKLPARP